MPITDNIEYLTAEEYAARYKMHPGSVARACAEGRLKGEKIGGRWRIPADARDDDVTERLDRIEEELSKVAAFVEAFERAFK